LERVGVQEHQIGELPDLDSPERVRRAEVDGRVQGRRPKRLRRLEAGVYEQLEFVVYAKAGKGVWVRRVAAGQRYQPRYLHRAG
jgi:hypothetical protein